MMVLLEEVVHPGFGLQKLMNLCWLQAELVGRTSSLAIVQIRCSASQVLSMGTAEPIV